MSIELQLENLPQVQQVLNQLWQRTQDLSDPMAQIAAIMADASERAFASEADPETGTPWPALKPQTQQRREQDNHWPGSILQVTGSLAASIDADSGPDFAIIGTNKVYAPTLFFGATQGEYGQTDTGHPLPWGSITPRRFIGVNAEDEAQMLEVLAQALQAT